MIDTKKAYKLLTRHISYCECSLYGQEPDPENDFWIPFSEELSKDIDAAIIFLESLNPNEFKYALEALDEIIEKTHSRKLFEAVKKIGKEKHINKVYMENVIERVSCWLSD